MIGAYVTIPPSVLCRLQKNVRKMVTLLAGTILQLDSTSAMNASTTSIERKNFNRNGGQGQWDCQHGAAYERR